MFDGDRDLAHKAWQVNGEIEAGMGFYQFDKEVVAFINKACERLFKENQQSDGQ